MSENPPEYSQGWWKAADEKWYPPQRHPDYEEPPVPPSPVMTSSATRLSADAQEESSRLQPNQQGERQAGSKLRVVVRNIGFALFAIAAAVVAIQAAPNTDAADLALAGLRQDPDAVAIARVQGESRFDVQESAPQEQVANGLETNDLLEIVADRQDDLLETIASRPVDNRVPLLLMILVFSIAWYAVTLPRVERDDKPHRT